MEQPSATPPAAPGKTLPETPGADGHAAKRVLGAAEPEKPAFSLGTLFPEFKGRSLFGAGEPAGSLFGALKPGALFARPAGEAAAADTEEEEEEPPAAEPSEDEAELLRRNPNPHVYATFFTVVERREVANFRVDTNDALGPGSVAIEQAKDDSELRQLVMRNKAKKILYSCVLLRGGDHAVRLKGKPGLSLFGYAPRVAGRAAPAEQGKAGQDEPAVSAKEQSAQSAAEPIKASSESAKEDTKTPEQTAKEDTKKPDHTATEDTKALEPENAKASEAPFTDAKAPQSAAPGSDAPFKRDNVKILFLSAEDADAFLAALAHSPLKT